VAKLVKGGVRLRTQLNVKYPKRDKRSDGWIGDKAHADKASAKKRGSFHNPDSRGWVHALDIDENFGKRGPWRNGRNAKKLTKQLLAYAQSDMDGSERLLHVVYNGKVASGTYKKYFWKFRGSGYGHWQHIHISFTRAAETDGSVWPLPILAKDKKQRKRWEESLKNE